MLDSSSLFLSFDGIGETFDDSINPMTSTTSSTNNPYEKKVTLNWTPTSNDVRTEPYIINSRFLMVLILWIILFVYVNQDNTGLVEYTTETLKSFPNPSNGLFTSQICVNKSQIIEYIITNNFGKVVSNRKINLKNGMNKILFNENLPAGMYVVTFKLESGEFISNKILIKN